MRSRLMPTLTAPLVLLLLLVGPARGQDIPPVVSAMPETFEAAIIVPNLANLSDQLANFESATGLGIGELQDALGMFQRELGLINGMKRDGSMMVVIGGAADGDANAGPSAVMLLPVTDYAAFVAALGGDAAQATAAMTLPGGTSGFCRALDQFAVLGGDRAAVEAVAVGQGLNHLTTLVGQSGLQTVGTSQLSIVINPVTFGPDALAQRLPIVIGQVLTVIDSYLAVDLAPQPWMPLIQAWSKQAAAGTTGMVVGMSFSGEGLAYHEAAMLKQDTELAAGFAGPGQADTSALLMQLPDKPIVFAAAGDPQAVSLAALVDQLGGIIGLSPEGALGEVKPMLDEMLKPASGCAFALYAVPPGKIQSHWFNSATILKTDDPAAQRAAFKQFITKLNGATLPLENGESVTLVALYRENERQINGVQVDTFNVRMMVPASVQTDPLTQVIALLAGGGFTGQVVSGPNQIIVTTVDDTTMTAELIEKAANPNGLGNAGPLADLRLKHLPPQPTVQAYLNFSGIAESLNPFLQLMGNASPFAVPNNLPPVAMGMTSDGQGVRSVTFIPTETIKLLATESFDLSPDEQDPNNPGF